MSQKNIYLRFVICVIRDSCLVSIDWGEECYKYGFDDGKVLLDLFLGLDSIE